MAADFGVGKGGHQSPSMGGVAVFSNADAHLSDRTPPEGFDSGNSDHQVERLGTVEKAGFFECNARDAFAIVPELGIQALIFL